LINLTLRLLEIFLLALANLAKQMCLGMEAANTVLANVLEDTSSHDPLCF